jgi:hypothetical protein
MDCRETFVTGPLTGEQEGDVEGVLSHRKPKACSHQPRAHCPAQLHARGSIGKRGSTKYEAI